MFHYSFRDIKMRTWSWSVNKLETGQTVQMWRLAWLYAGGKSLLVQAGYGLKYLKKKYFRIPTTQCTTSFTFKSGLRECFVIFAKCLTKSSSAACGWLNHGSAPIMFVRCIRCSIAQPSEPVCVWKLGNLLEVQVVGSGWNI